MAIDKLKHTIFAGLTALTIGCSSPQPEAVHQNVQEGSIEMLVTEHGEIPVNLDAENTADEPVLTPLETYDQKKERIFSNLYHDCNNVIVPGRPFQLTHSIRPFYESLQELQTLDKHDRQKGHELVRKGFNDMIENYQNNVGSACLQLMTRIYCAQNPKYARDLFLRLAPFNDINFKKSPLREFRTSTDELYRISAIALQATQESREFYERVFDQLYERFGRKGISYDQAKEVHELANIAKEKMNER